MGTGSSTTRVVPFSHHHGHSQLHDTDLSGDFYWACRSGNLQAVINIYPKLTYEQLNRIQSNGSTPLHAACSLNYPHIVKFLLENGCCRTTLNSQNKTAYEIAASEQIRRLFERPCSKRFVQEQGANSFNFCSATDTSSKELERPDDWITGRTWKDFAYEAQFMLALGKSSSLFKKIVKKRLERNHHEELRSLLDRTITIDNRQRPKAVNFFENFLNKMGVHNLITLYTMQTDFYDALKKEADALTAILYLNLSELQNRAFKGHAYRGAIMTEDDLDGYRWALKKEKSWHENLLETRILQSLSIKKSVALDFSKNKGDKPGYSVLMELEFPELCPTAINLNKITEQLPALSEFQNEGEVLLLPFTLFKVKDIYTDPELHEYRILLIHEPTPKRSLRRAASEVDYFGMA